MTDRIILPCPHCGNKTLMELLDHVEKVTNVPLNPFEDVQFTDNFDFLICPVCDGYHIFHTHWNTEDSYLAGDDIYEDGSVIFPVGEKVNLFSLPKSIKTAYESALRVKNIDNTVCMIALRRTLEMVCKDNGAVNGPLHQKLTDLQHQGILPPLIGDISKVIKDFGNMAAHGDQVSFEKHMVESMFRFTNKVLEYVYVLPKEMERIKRDLEALTEEANEKEETK